MSTALLILTGFMLVLGGLALVRPALLFTYPVAAGLLMLAFIVPQAWVLEQSGAGLELDPPLAWNYMSLCMVALVIGFVSAARARRTTEPGKTFGSEVFFSTYSVDRLLQGCVVLAVIGVSAWILMLRQASTLEEGVLWTGVIALYAALTLLLQYGAWHG